MMMNDAEREIQIVHLWNLALAKARGAVKVIEIFGDLNRKIYLYGSDKKHDYLYDQDNMKPAPIVIMPNSKIKNFWNIIMMLLVVYTGLYIPYKTAFIDESPDYVNYIELSIDSLFVVDILMNFISAFEDRDKNIEFRLSRIAINYLKTWFIFDVVSCIPF